MLLPGSAGFLLSTPTPLRVSAMSTRALLAVRLSIGAIQNLGAVPGGTRTIFPIAGGTFEGSRLSGKILPGGADWVLTRPDGTLEIDLRLTLETSDAALVYMTFQGIRHRLADPANDYFRSIARFETSAPKYQFLNRMLAVGSGEIRDGAPIHTFEEVL